MFSTLNARSSGSCNWVNPGNGTETDAVSPESRGRIQGVAIEWILETGLKLSFNKVGDRVSLTVAIEWILETGLKHVLTIYTESNPDPVAIEWILETGLKLRSLYCRWHVLGKLQLSESWKRDWNSRMMSNCDRNVFVAIEWILETGLKHVYDRSGNGAINVAIEWILETGLKHIKNETVTIAQFSCNWVNPGNGTETSIGVKQFGKYHCSCNWVNPGNGTETLNDVLYYIQIRVAIEWILETGLKLLATQPALSPNIKLQLSESWKRDWNSQLYHGFSGIYPLQLSESWKRDWNNQLRAWLEWFTPVAIEWILGTGLKPNQKIKTELQSGVLQLSESWKRDWNPGIPCGPVAPVSCNWVNPGNGTETAKELLRLFLFQDVAIEWILETGLKQAVWFERRELFGMLQLSESWKRDWNAQNTFNTFNSVECCNWVNPGNGTETQERRWRMLPRGSCNWVNPGNGTETLVMRLLGVNFLRLQLSESWKRDWNN